MGGLFIDIVIVFIAKSLLRGIAYVRSRRWDRRNATLREVSVLHYAFGCDCVRARYVVEGSARGVESIEEIPFMLPTNGSLLASRLGYLRAIVVRVNPVRAAESRFFLSDQS